MEDPNQLLREMARLVDRQTSNAALMVLQGAPDNEANNLVNYMCHILPYRKMAISHQVFLLHQAETFFKESGFNDIPLNVFLKP